MNKHEQLMNLYTGVLTSLDIIVEDNGELSFQPKGEIGKDGKPMRLPAIVDKKRWVLPTRDVLAMDGVFEDHIAFHPLSENILNSFSETIIKLKSVVNYKVNL